MDSGGGASAHRGDVLVVDDHAAIRAFVREILEGAGYAVREAADGTEALRLARAARPELILLDLGMPVMDGRQFAAAYRRKPGSQAPVVVMTAAQDVARGSAALAALDAAGSLGKLFSMAELLATLRRVTERGAPPASEA